MYYQLLSANPIPKGVAKQAIENPRTYLTPPAFGACNTAGRRGYITKNPRKELVFPLRGFQSDIAGVTSSASSRL